MLRSSWLRPLLARLHRHHSTLTRRAGKRATRLRLESLEDRTVPTWIGATSGTTNDAAHDYNNPANWVGGVIDDSFEAVTFTTDTTLFFTADRTTTASGLNLNYNGNFDLSFVSSSATTQTLTLAGPISGDFGGDATARVVNIGSPANPVNIDLGEDLASSP